MSTRPFVGILVLALSGMVFAKATVAQEDGERETRRRQSEAYATGGLRAAAAITGSAVRSVPCITAADAPKSIRELGAKSDLVVIGWTASNVSRLSTDGKSIALHYEVRLEKTLKGGPPAAADITVLIPGGKVSFPDGSWAMEMTPNFPPPANNQSVLWFLSRVASKADRSGVDPDVFMPTHGPLGVYSLQGTRGVRPHGGVGSSLSRALIRQHWSPEQFISHVMSEIR